MLLLQQYSPDSSSLDSQHLVLVLNVTMIKICTFRKVYLFLFLLVTGSDALKNCLFLLNYVTFSISNFDLNPNFLIIAQFFYT